jgi:RNA polymerase sigma-70 factor (ECF subfamily)
LAVPRELKGQTSPMLPLTLAASAKVDPTEIDLIKGGDLTMAALGPFGPGRARPPGPAREQGSDPARERELRLRKLVDEYVDFVARVLRNAGTPQGEIDDEVQRTFITAARRLDDVRPGSEKGFLFRIALNLAAHARRTLARRREVPAEEAPERVDTLASPEQLTDQKRMRRLLDQVLGRMEATLRAVFVLYEFEEMNMSEIASVLGIPRGTVASRLRRARVEFRARVRLIEDSVKNEKGERKP